ncbi:uncharacterized protein LOC135156911 [Lytechinus pictus]|uniref:uncharacterized protein LOC135156911 n=1 Tax=Lytechinus pictus TaxID=7653 RepID=UPI0030BA1A0F
MVRVLALVLLVVALNGMTEAIKQRYQTRNKRHGFWRPKIPKRIHVPPIRVPHVKIPPLQIRLPIKPEVRDRKIKITKVDIPEIRIPNPVHIQIPDIQLPEIRMPDTPDLRVPDIRNEMRPVSGRVSKWFRELSKRKFRAFTSNHPHWTLTMGWFDQSEMGPNDRPRPRPGPVGDQNNPRQSILGSRDRSGGLGPRFNTLCRGRHYSARRYEPTTWVSATFVNGTSLDVLRRIKGYFNGANDQGRVILMSRPLRMTVEGANGTISNTEDTLEEFTLSALVPSRAPTPTDPMLRITSEPRQVYFATHFRLHRRPGTLAIYDEYFDSKDSLDLAGESFQHGIYHSAFYETWAEIRSPSSRPHPGEILIPAAPGENLACARQEVVNHQNGIKQCGESRCPTYEHLEQLRDDIELRRIKGGTHITRAAPACTFTIPAFINHCALNKYLAGANSEGIHYASRAPFIHHVSPSSPGPSICTQTAISAYMLPPNITAAEPTECSGFHGRDMRLRTVPDKEVYVLKFSGRPNQMVVESKVDELRGFLRERGLEHCFQKRSYAVAVYDHPFSRPPHLNEIFVFKKSGPCRPRDINRPNIEDLPAVTPDSILPTSSASMMTTEPMFFEEETSTTTRAVEETTTRRSTTSVPDRVSTTTATTHSPLIEVDLTLESNSVDLSNDLIPYRFSGNQTDFPEDFPVDIFVY